MPHIIVEYSESLDGPIDMQCLLGALHEALAAQGIDKTRIKTRGIPVAHAFVGEKGKAGTMIHATLLLLEGRDVATKKQYGDALHEILKKASAKSPVCATTLEIRDMNKDTYYL